MQAYILLSGFYYVNTAREDLSRVDVSFLLAGGTMEPTEFSMLH